MTKKKETKVVYSVDYIPNEMGVKMSDLLSKMGLGIEGIFISEEFIITTKTKVDKIYIQKVKDLIVKAIEKNGGKVFKIKYKHKIIK